MKMNVLINLIPIKKGGGQQVATNFVIQTLKRRDVVPTFLVTEGTNIHRLLEKEKSNLVIIKDSIRHRVAFQLLELNNVIEKYEINIIYTLFGPGLHSSKVKSVTGSAYSNIYFPEIPFWEEYPIVQRIKRSIIDRYRLKSTLRSSAIIFENESMLRRAHSLFKFPKEQTIYIPPSISEHTSTEPSASFIKRLGAINKDQYNILILSGWHKNKKIESIPYILSELNKKGEKDVRFIISVDPDNIQSIKLMEKARELGVEGQILLFGSVKPEEVYPLFEKIDSVMLLSLLESFSNNIIEAWNFQKLLFISNEEWSRAICKDGAVYVDRNDVFDISDKIIKFKTDSGLRNNIISNSINIFQTYPTPEEKVNIQIDFLKKIYNNG